MKKSAGRLRGIQKRRCFRMEDYYGFKENGIRCLSCFIRKKGEDITVLEISDISILTDYFLIATGNSSSQIQAMIDNVEEKMQEAGYKMKRLEGNRNSTWILMDFGDVVIHLFDKEDRLFYDLERIWSDGKRIEPQELM